MFRHLVALILMWVGLQGPLTAFAAFAAIAPGQSDCPATAESAPQHTERSTAEPAGADADRRAPAASHPSCCPSKSHGMNGCLDACPTPIAVTSSSAAPVWYRRTVLVLQFLAMNFSTRGDSPLIRPPIL